MIVSDIYTWILFISSKIILFLRLRSSDWKVYGHCLDHKRRQYCLKRTKRHLNCLEHANGHHNCPEHTNGHQHCPEHTNGHQHCPEHTNGHQHCPEHTNGHQHCPEHTNGHQHCTEHTNGHQHCPEDARKVSKAGTLTSVAEITWWNIDICLWAEILKVSHMSINIVDTYTLIHVYINWCMLSTTLMIL